MKGHYAEIGIVNMIRQRLKDIELQRWLCEIQGVPKVPSSGIKSVLQYDWTW